MAIETKSRPGRAPDYRLPRARPRRTGVGRTAVSDRSQAASKLPARRRRHIIQWVVAVVVVVLVAIFLRASVVQPFSVSSGSMSPTLRAGTDVLVLKSDLLMGRIEKGDIVVVHEPAAASCSPAATGPRPRGAGDRRTGPDDRSSRGHIEVNGRRLNEKGWYNPSFGEVGPTAITPTRSRRAVTS